MVLGSLAEEALAGRRDGGLEPMPDASPNAGAPTKIDDRDDLHR
jgi:hypothetical protein